MNTLGLDDIEIASQRIAAHIARTPLLYSPVLGSRTGFGLWLKAENSQITGSFKLRGALNKMFSLSPEEIARGIVASSAGNHALGVAHAARILQLEAVELFVQANAAPAKLAKLRTYNVQLHLVGETFEEAQSAALARVEQARSTFVSPYDDVEVIAGQGTCGLEIMQDLPDADAIVVPVGGGGLIAGIATAAKALNPRVRIVGVNPTASPSALLSKRDGRPYDPYDHGPTLALALAGGFGRVPYAIGMEKIDDIVLISDEEIMHAMTAMIDAHQVLLEPSGAAALAAVLSGKVRCAGKCVAVLSGGNIDAHTLKMVLNQSLV